MPSDYESTFGDDELLETYVEFATVGDDIDEPDAIRFMRGVAKLYRRRLRVDGGSEDGVGVFLLAPAPDLLADDATWFPMLDDGATRLAGWLWSVGPPVVSAYGRVLPSADAAEIFRFVTDELHAGDIPAVVLDPNGERAEVRFYPHGLGAADDCSVAPVFHDSVDIDAILAVVETVCCSVLITPDGHVNGVSIWQNRSRYYPDKQAEVRIQSYIKTGLSGAFPTCTINREQPNTLGRLDLEVEESDDSEPGRFVRHAVLELKVLRSFGSTGVPVSVTEVADWIREGVVQAASYRDERQALAAALCCFDMRTAKTGEACFHHVRTDAARLSVETRVWPIFPTAKAARSFRTEVRARAVR